MTRTSHARWSVEALESKAFLSRLVSVPHPAVIALTPADVTSGSGGPSGAAFGTYGHAGAAYPVHATGTVDGIGTVNATGSIKLTGPKSNQTVNGLLTFTGSQGTVKIQINANHAITTPGGLGVNVQETVTGATGGGTALLGERGGGAMELGRWVGTIHPYQFGTPVPAHGAFSIYVGLNPAIR